MKFNSGIIFCAIVVIAVLAVGHLRRTSEDIRLVCLPNGDDARKLREKVERDGEVEYPQIPGQPLSHGDLVKVVQPLVEETIPGIGLALLVEGPLSQSESENNESSSKGLIGNRYLSQAKSCP